MPEFSFLARDGSGRPQSGVLAADNPSQLAAQLRSRGWIVMEVNVADQHTLSIAGVLAMANPMRWLPATRLDVELGLQQLATMLRSGLTLLSALRTAAEQARRPAMAKVWTHIAERIEEGSTFADALAAHGRLFPSMVVQLVRVGEESGTLDNVLKRSAVHLERSRMVRTTFLTSLMYPALVLVAALGVTAFMVFSLIPKLQKFLAGRGRKLPQMSQMLLDGTNWTNANGTTILLVILAVLMAAVILYRLPWGRSRIDRGLLRLPLIGGLLRLAGTAMVARGLSILLESGITLLTALQTVRGLLSNRAMQARLETARSAVIEGSALADPLLEGREFPPMLGRMVAVGETTGTLGTVLGEVADFHEGRLVAAVRRLSALIEPATIVVVGGIVGFVYIAFFWRCFSGWRSQMISRGSSLMALLAMSIATMAAAQETTTHPTATSSPSVTTEPAAADPTQPDQRLRTFLNPPATRSSAEKSALARVTKRAFLQTANHVAEALIEVEGSGMVEVKEGSIVSFATRQGQPVTIRVIKLSPDEIEIEVPATGEKATIR